MKYNNDVNEIIRFRDYMLPTGDAFRKFLFYNNEIREVQKKNKEPVFIWAVIKGLSTIFILWGLAILGIKFALYKEWGFAVNVLCDALRYLCPVEYAPYLLLGLGVAIRILGNALVNAEIKPCKKYISEMKSERVKLHATISKHYAEYPAIPPIDIYNSNPDCLTIIIEELKYGGCKTVQEAIDRNCE